MANDIIGSMFGVDPNQIAMENLQRAYQQNAQMASQDPLSGGLMANVGSNIGMLGARAMGLTTREEDQAKARQGIGQMIADGKPSSYLAAAQKANEAGDSALAHSLYAEANKLTVQAQNMEYQRTQDAYTKKRMAELDEEKRKIDTEEVSIGNGMMQKFEKAPDGTVTTTPVGKPYPMFAPKAEKGTDADGLSPRDRLNWKKTHDKAYLTTAASVSSAESTITKANDMLNDKNFSKVFGGYTEKALSAVAMGKWRDSFNKLETLKADMKKSGLSLVREGGGIGAISQAEWPILERQIDALSSDMSESGAKIAIKAIQNKLAVAANESANSYKESWSGEVGGFYKSGVTTRAEALFKKYGAEQQATKPPALTSKPSKVWDKTTGAWK